MESHNPRPRANASSIFCDVGCRLAFVLSFDVTSSGSDAWKALRELIVRGIPLKLIHFRPTSRMNSAFWTAELGSFDDATWWRTGRESGELRVNVAAAYNRQHSIWRTIGLHTETVNQDFGPRFLIAASFAIASNNS